MTLQQILENENIKADRFGMAAISYIFKAFGDDIRSKEYWPWGSTVNFPWEESKGLETDLTNANLCITQAKIRSKKESTIKIKENNKNGIKALKKRLDQIMLGNKKSNVISTNINATSELAQNEISSYTGNN